MHVNYTSRVNTRIAEALGYKLETDPHGSGLRAWRLAHRDRSGIRDSEGNRLVLFAEQRLPDWEHDLNAAFSLLKELPAEHNIGTNERGGPIQGWLGVASIEVYSHGMVNVDITLFHPEQRERRYNGGADDFDLCAAICLAWLAWHAAQEAEAHDG
jgi:hypothetical protein